MAFKSHKTLYEELLPVLQKYGANIDRYKKTKKLLHDIDFVTLPFKWIASLTGINLGILVLLFLIAVAYINPFIFIIAPLLYYLIKWGATLRRRKLTKDFKEDFVTALFMDNDISVRIEADSHINKAAFNKAELFEKLSISGGEDLVQGSFKNMNFMFSEVKTSKNSYDDNFFEGLFFTGAFINTSEEPLDLHIKSLRSYDQKKPHNNNFLSGKFQKQISISSRNKTSHLENILTEEMQERLLYLKNQYRNKFEIHIKDHQITFLIHGKRDYFPISENKEVTDYNLIKNLTIDVYFFADMIKWINDLSGQETLDLTKPIEIKIPTPENKQLEP